MKSGHGLAGADLRDSPSKNFIHVFPRTPPVRIFEKKTAKLLQSGMTFRTYLAFALRLSFNFINLLRAMKVVPHGLTLLHMELLSHSRGNRYSM